MKYLKKNAILIQKQQPEIPENQFINRDKNPNHEHSENIIQKN